MPDDERYSLTELADLGGVTPRTVRYYLAQGLLPAVGASGPGSKYDATHLARLRLIRRLQAEHLPLAEIRRRLDGLDVREISELAGSHEPAPPADSALEYLRTVLAGSRPAGSSVAAPPLVPVVPPSAPAGPDLGARPTRPLLARRCVGLPVARTAHAERLGEPDPPAATVSPPETRGATSGPIERSQWERIGLGPDVELHIRRPLARAQQKAVDRLVTIAHELLEEDRP